MGDRREFFEEFWCGDLGMGRKRGRGWRLFERGDLKFVILRLISKEPMHGYQVMQALEEEAGPWYKPSPGSVYPTLQMLEDEGLVRCEAKEGKKVYEITDEGKKYLEENEDVVDKIFSRVGSFAEGFFGRRSRELTGSFSKLAHLVLETTLTGRTDPESVEKMVDILDRAREEMEEVVRGKTRGAETKEEEGKEKE